jgi:hypothetical protein
MAIRHWRSGSTASSADHLAERRAVTQLALHGVLGGIIAGIVFAMAAMVMAAALQGEGSAFWMPLRMIGAIVLGDKALMSGYSLGQAALVGVMVHMMMAALFGLIFGLAVAFVPALRPPVRLIVAAAVYGLLLWLVNFQVIARAAGWNWFPDMADQFWQGFVAHSFFFGAVLGMYLAAVRPWRTAST